MQVRFPELLKAILDEPWSELPRLVYADAIDDAGDPELAAAIRSRFSNKSSLCRLDEKIFAMGETPIRLLWYGGFIVEIAGPQSVLLKYGPEIAAVNPLERVIVTDNVIQYQRTAINDAVLAEIKKRSQAMLEAESAPPQ